MKFDEESIDKVSRDTLAMLLMDRHRFRIIQRRAKKTGYRIGGIEQMRKNPETIAAIRRDPEGALERHKAQLRERFAAEQ